MDTAAAWQQLFETWPQEQPRVGIIVTTGQENIPFTRFMTMPGVIALERDRPDTSGARKVILALTAITAVKMTDTNDFANLSLLGFE